MPTDPCLSEASAKDEARKGDKLLDDEANERIDGRTERLRGLPLESVPTPLGDDRAEDQRRPEDGGKKSEACETCSREDEPDGEERHRHSVNDEIATITMRARVLRTTAKRPHSA